MSAAPPKPLNLPDDAPLAPELLPLFDAGRLSPLANALFARLAQWQALDGKARLGQVPPRLGLFGGLGQGKSSVMLSVMQQLRDQQAGTQKWRQLLFGSSVVRFDVSYFKADDLEWRFLTAVLWRRILATAAWMLLLLLSLIATAVTAYTIAQEWELKKWLQQHSLKM